MSVKYLSKVANELTFITTGLSDDEVDSTGNGTSFDRETVHSSPKGPLEEGFLVVQVESIDGDPSAILLTLRIEDSANNTEFAAVTDLANVEGETLSFTGAGFKTLSFRPAGLRRYVRAAITEATLTDGTSPSVKLRAFFALAAPRQV